AIFHGGTASLRWEYTLPSVPANNYPTIEMAIPSGTSDWSGATKLGVWMYFDLSAPKTGWTIQPVLCHPYPTVRELGNWNAGPGGVPNDTWVYNEWDIPGELDLSNVSHLRFYYHAGDGWESVAESGKVVIYLDDIVVIGTIAEDKTLTILELDGGTNLKIEGLNNHKFVGYIPLIGAYGRWTDIRGWSNPPEDNLVDGGGGFYDHPVVWFGGSNWSDGSAFVGKNILTNNARIVEWQGTWNFTGGASHNFDSKIVSQKILIRDDGLMIVRTEAQVDFNLSASDINNIYVEFGWHMNDYTNAIVVHRADSTTTTIVSTNDVDISGSPGTHHFDGEILDASKGDYICGYGGSTYNVSVALVPKGWDDTGQSYCRCWDTAGTGDITDTIELHYYNPQFFAIPKSVSNGESHTLIYYLLISPRGVTGYEWVPSLKELDDSFIYYSTVKDWLLFDK
ncbi:hypothetical protein J7M23_00780, partial [Candidatus Sumerlaeota bacterium]|nr:hypothetical protein [Candidatus Sumerlaeota bacterium]